MRPFCYLHYKRKLDSIRNRKKGLHLPDPNSEEIVITMDKASQFQLSDKQLKGGVKNLTFMNFLTRTPYEYGDEDSKATGKTKPGLIDEDNFQGRQVCHLYFFDNPEKLSMSEVVTQLQGHLRARLKKEFPGYSLTWISDGAPMECKNNCGNLTYQGRVLNSSTGQKK